MGSRRGSLVAVATAVAGALGWRAHSAAVGTLRDSIRAERRWSRDLRDQLHGLHAQSGPMGEGEDVRDLVLRTAIGLLGAEKGVLLSRADDDDDGDFDLVCAHGFTRDPEHLAVVQRFTGEVLARDQMVLEDAVEGDPEIDNLVAVPVYLFEHFHGVVICANRPGGFGDVDDNVLLALGDHAGAALHSQRLQRERRDTHRGALKMLSEIVAAHDPAMGAAAAEAALLAAAIARRMGIDGPERDALVCAAALRDVGLLAISVGILDKAAPLIPPERSAMQRHPQIGFEVIGQLPALRDVALAVLCHHERYDGTGYPAGLAGEAIPRAARVIAVIDAYCAITHDRPYRPARTMAEAVAELVAGTGTQFDPEVVERFVEELDHPQLRRIDAGTTEAIMEWLLLPDRRQDALATAAADEAPIDGLTQLPAHRALHEAAAPAGRCAVLVVEVEGLRAINERKGYATGDRTLITVARKLGRAAARSGLIAYRDGGARFAVIATGDDVVRRLLEDVRAEFALGPAVEIRSEIWTKPMVID